MNISGKTMIFKSKEGYYSTSISNKKQDGTYENMFIQVNFKKGIDIPNKTEINITEGFVSFYKTRDGLPKTKFVITKFESDENFVKNDTESDSNNVEEISDLPF